MVGVLERSVYEGRGCVRVKLTVCPYCGHVFADHEPRWKHFLDNHGPEDAGLSPAGEQPAAAAEPLFSSTEDFLGGEKA